jgi:predicted SnoaL-like aldol condensation-catalyzing enzyme
MEQKLHNVISLFIDGVRDGDLCAVLNKYVVTNLVQHTPGIARGRAGLYAAFYPLVARYDRRNIRPLRGFIDGTTVFLHSFQSYGYRNVERITIDVFDTDGNDQIVEHWSATSPLARMAATGLSQIDGPTFVEDLPAGIANKHLVDDYLNDVIIGGHPASEGKYAGPAYVDHAGPVDGSLAYVDVMQLTGAGNFVASVSNAMIGSCPYVVADLYRVEGNRLVEHWNTSQPS